MNTRYLAIALAIGAEAMIAVGMFLLIPFWMLTDEVRWLDFTVLTLINAIVVLNVIFPFVKMSDRSHKEVAGLGIRWSATGWYAALAILFMLFNIIYVAQNGEEACGFKIQAFVQAALLLLFLCGVLFSQESINKAREVYVEEQHKKRGKADVRGALTALLNAAERQRELDPETSRRIRDLVAEGRYITPSAATEAREADEAIIFDCEALATALEDFSPKNNITEDRLFRLENALRRRKRL